VDAVGWLRARGKDNENMKLSAPTQLLFIVSVVLAILSLVGRFQTVDFITPNAYWLMLVGWLVLAVGCLFRRA
jgi:hypothetical protein